MDKSFKGRLLALGFDNYKDYLFSPHWKDVRARWRDSSMPKKCLGCKSDEYQLHHRDYTRLGAEALTDFVPLCRGCHTALHEQHRLTRMPLALAHVLLKLMFGWTGEEMRERFAQIGMPGYVAPKKGTSKKRKKGGKPKRPRWKTGGRKMVKADMPPAPIAAGIPSPRKSWTKRCTFEVASRANDTSGWATYSKPAWE